MFREEGQRKELWGEEKKEESGSGRLYSYKEEEL